MLGFTLYPCKLAVVLLDFKKVFLISKCIPQVMQLGDILALGPSVVFMVATTSHSKPPAGILVKLAHTSTEPWLSFTIYSEDTIVTVASVKKQITIIIIMNIRKISKLVNKYLHYPE